MNELVPCGRNENVANSLTLSMRAFMRTGRGGEVEALSPCTSPRADDVDRLPLLLIYRPPAGRTARDKQSQTDGLATI